MRKDADMKQITIVEHRVEGKPLGRNVLHDPRSLDFQAMYAPKLQSVIHQSRGLPFTQVRGSCTSEALCGALNSDPDFTGRTFTQDDAEYIYDEEIILEGGDPATDDPGGTGLEVCKAGQLLGLVKSYRHAFGLQHTLGALIVRPVMIGCNWYESMDSPDETTGAVTIAGEIRGGHEFVLDELDVTKEWVGAWNSWGEDWGLRGKFYIPWEVLEQLLHEDGDATVPYVERKQPSSATGHASQQEIDTLTQEAKEIASDLEVAEQEIQAEVDALERKAHHHLYPSKSLYPSKKLYPA